MHLVELLIPLTKRSAALEQLDVLGRLFSETFGGATLFVWSPGEGLWKDDAHTSHDEIAVIEVMTRELDRRWWADLRHKLEIELGEKEIMIRASEVDRL